LFTFTHNFFNEDDDTGHELLKVEVKRPCKGKKMKNHSCHLPNQAAAEHCRINVKKNKQVMITLLCLVPTSRREWRRGRRRRQAAESRKPSRRNGSDRGEEQGPDSPILLSS
jgi:hypothetical protein